MQDWEAVKKLGASATSPLIDMLKVQHPAMRARIVEILGSIGGAVAERTCERILRDPDENVRWSGVLSSRNCGVPSSRLPRELAQRQRTGPSVFAATILNFFFLGIGYDYLGKWWGFLLLEIYMLLFLISQLLVGLVTTLIMMVPVMSVFAVQTYFMAKKEAALAG
jgi:hypothetical protein